MNALNAEERRILKQFGEQSTLKPEEFTFPFICSEKNPPFLTVAMEEQFVTLQKQRTLLLPRLNNQATNSIAVFSDYGGEQKSAQYRTYSFLVVSYDILGNFFAEMRNQRELAGMLHPYREISYKELKDGPVMRILEPWLISANNSLCGILYNIAIHRELDSIFGLHPKELTKFLDKETDFDCSAWKPSIVEKALRIVHPLSYLVALLSRTGQKIFWMTDNDSIASNRKQRKQLGNLLQRTLNLYTKHEGYATVDFATPWKNEKEKIPQYDWLDCLSLTDMVAGSLAEMLPLHDEGGVMRVKKGSNRVLDWLSYQGIGLKKYTLFFRKGEGNLIQSYFLQIKTDDSFETEYVHLPL